jgi:hypothetical protein
MNTERIYEIQRDTLYPDSISVQQALLKVWNECEQDKKTEIGNLISEQTMMLREKNEEIKGLNEALYKDSRNKDSS